MPGQKIDSRCWSTIIFPRTGGMKSRTRKLDEEQVYAIRADHDKGMNSADGSKKYGITRNTFWMIGTRRSWKGLPEREA